MNRILSILSLCFVFALSGCEGDNIIMPDKSIDIGTIIHSGQVNPTSEIGKEGDFYINLSNQILFGPKKESSWGTGIALSGADGSPGQNGEDGINGNTILNGNGAPASSIGSLGDFYFDTENISIYGAKTSSGWGTPVNLKQGASSGIRILIKENIKLPVDYQNLRIHSDGTTHAVHTDDVPIAIKTGNIQSYIDNGAVIIQCRINNNFWRDGEDYIDKKNNDYRFSINVFSSGISISEYDGENIIFDHNTAHISEYGGDINDLPNLLKSEIDKHLISYKIILIPGDSVEKLSKQFPAQRIDDIFLGKYYSISK